MKEKSARERRGGRERLEQICQWKPEREKSPADSDSFSGILASLFLNISGGNGYGNAYAVSTAFVDWFATTDVSDAVSGTHKIKLTRTQSCAKPSPVVELEAISNIRLAATANGPATASASGTCKIAGDLKLENQIGVISGSVPTSTQFSLGGFTIQPFTQSTGRLAPPDSIVPESVTKNQPDASMLAAGSLALKAKAWDDTGEAEAEINSSLTGYINARCKHCSGTARIDF